ncbi:Aste57867_21246 [Aphanomyces stellatus]|uniref:Aste57867_21246 protein n=1 Tax=Aphanomyces stellatus TaxID=120398 RepID=A0A485LH27_9STRA|nr:hypothetical protein As57867_021177 [Aphanomyces stellatus]VFT97918.1 Aste57867_21246 [Aphanomyces stellatus]
MKNAAAPSNCALSMSDSIHCSRKTTPAGSKDGLNRACTKTRLFWTLAPFRIVRHEALNARQWASMLLWLDSTLYYLGYDFDELEEEDKKELWSLYYTDHYKMNEMLDTMATLVSSKIAISCQDETWETTTSTTPAVEQPPLPNPQQRSIDSLTAPAAVHDPPPMPPSPTRRASPSVRRVNDADDPSVVTWDRIAELLAKNNDTLIEKIKRSAVVPSPVPPTENHASRATTHARRHRQDNDDSYDEDDDENDDDGTSWSSVLAAAPTATRGIPIVNLENIPVFEGVRDGREKAAQWIRKFDQVANLSGWTEAETAANFKAYVGKSVRAWCGQLEPDTRRTWKRLRRKFMDVWVVNPLPKFDKYTCMVQKPKETKLEFFIDSTRPPMAPTCGTGPVSESSRTTSTGSYCDCKTRRLERTWVTPSSRARSMLNGTYGSKRRSRPWSSWGHESHSSPMYCSSTASRLRAAPLTVAAPAPLKDAPSSASAEVYALGQNYQTAKRKQCDKCSSEHYRVGGECWRSTTCGVCNKVGHPDTQCFKACQQCDPPHHRTNQPCPFKAMLKKVKAHLDDPPGALRKPRCAGLDTRLELEDGFVELEEIVDLELAADLPKEEPGLIGSEKMALCISAPSTACVEKGDRTIINFSFDPPPIEPKICFAGDETLAFWRKADTNDHGRSMQAFLAGRIMDTPSVVLADTGANMSLIQLKTVQAFGLEMDTSNIESVSGIASAPMRIFGTVMVKLTLGRGFVHFSCGRFKAGVEVLTLQRELRLPDGEYIPLLKQPVEYVRSFSVVVRTRAICTIAASDVFTVRLPKLTDPTPRGAARQSYRTHREHVLTLDPAPTFFYVDSPIHAGLCSPSVFLASSLPGPVNQDKMLPEVVVKEGVDMSTEEMTNQLAMIPEFVGDPTPVDLADLDFGEDFSTPEEKAKMADVLLRFQKFFIKSGNGLPPAARGAVCDIDVGDAKPIAHRARRVRGELMPKLYDLLKGLLNFGLIRFSNSAWASPIVLVLKKGGKDIRLCIDFRDINSLQKLMRSPMPTLDSMLADFHAIEWFLSLDNASGFWVFRSTKRAREISAFICPLGHFEWTRMAQGLKNAPMLYQRMITNALYGFVDLPPGMADVDNDGEPRDMFAIGFVRPASEMPRPANRTSFADDISDGATTWDGIVELVDRILTRLTYFNNFWVTSFLGLAWLPTYETGLSWSR